MRTNYILGIATFLLVSINSMAQENQNDYPSIFNKNGDHKISHGGYGSFGFGYTSIDDKDAILINFKGAWVIDHKVALGISGTGFFNNLTKTSNKNDDYLGGGYGGFYFEPILLSKSPIHLSFPILIGGGGISVIPNDYWDGNDYNYQSNYDVFFLVEPGVELEFNMVNFFRIALGASYRFTNGVLLNYNKTEAVPIDVLDGFNFYINFKFGKW